MGVEAAVRSRPMRLALVAGLTGLGVWAFAPYAAGDVATEAAINAPLVRVAAPIDGTVGALPARGAYFAAPARVELVRPAADAGALGAASAERAEALATADLARRQIAALAAEEARLAARAATFAGAARARLAADLAAARAETASCTDIAAENAAALARAERLAATGFMAAAGVEHARAAAARSRAACASAAARARALGVETDAAAAGVLLGDGANDQPYSAQQRDRLALRRQELEAVLLAAEARAGAAEARLAAARARANPLLPAGLYVWNVAASPGSAATAGEALLDLADCRRRFVDVALPERRAEAISAGDTARVRLVGSDRWLTGTVARVTGSAARGEGELFAAARAARAGDRAISVEVLLPAGAADAPERRCDIGRLAEVRFG